MAFKKKSIDELMKGTGMTRSEALNVDTQKQQQQIQAARTQPVVLPRAGTASGGGGGRVNAQTAAKITLPSSPILKFLNANDDAAAMTYGIYNPMASERTRVGNTIAAGAKGWTAGQANALAFLLDPTDDGSATDAEMMFDPTGAGRALGYNQVANDLNRARGKASRSLYQSAETLQKESKESEETAKKGAGKLASTLIDLGITGTQLALDATVGRATGTGMGSMGTRVFGQSARQALDEGATQQQAFNYGASAAAVELLTEKMFDVGKIFGKGAADDVVENTIEKAVKKWGLTNSGRTALRTFFAMASEGGEEVASDLVQPVIQEFYKSDAFKEAYLTSEGRKELFENSLRDFGLGAAMGGFGNVVNYGHNVTQNAQIDENIKNERLQALAEQKARQERIFGGNVMRTGTADAEAAELLRRNAQARGELVLPQAGKQAAKAPAVEEANSSRVLQKFMAGETITEAELETLSKDTTLAGSALKAMGQETGKSAEEIREKLREIAPNQIQTEPAAVDPELQARAAEAENEVRRSGILAGATEENIQAVERMAKALGKDIRFVNEPATNGNLANGHYERSTGILYVNTQSQNVQASIVAHELTHSTESAEIYKDLSQLIQNRIAKTADLSAVRNEISQRYAADIAAEVERGGKADDVIDHELVAEYVENHLLSSEEDIMSLVQQDRTLGQRIRDFLDRILAKLNNSAAQERAFIQKARDLYAQALAQSETTSGQQIASLKEQLRRGEITDEEFKERYDQAYNAEDALRAEVQNSYAGQNAKTANLQTLAQAKQLLAEDVAPETIRQQTGWFQGRDGKWRFESDENTKNAPDRSTMEQTDVGSEQPENLSQTEETQNDRQTTSGGNETLIPADLDDYLQVGEREHVRHTKQRIIQKGESPILTSEAEVEHFIQNSRNGNIVDEVRAYGKVGDEMNNQIVQAGGPDISGYYLELDSNRLAHLDDHVGEDKDSRNIPLTEEQVLHLPEYVDTFDDVIDVLRRKDGSVRLMLGKKINGHAVIIETVSKGRRSLQPVTAYVIPTSDYNAKYGHKKSRPSFNSIPPAQSTGTSGYQALQPAENSIPQKKTESNPLPKVNSSTLQNSISKVEKPEGVQLPKAGENSTREERLPEKAKRYLQRARNTAVNRLAETLSVPKWASREYLQPIAQQASEEYLRTGRVSRETRDRLFNEAYDQGIVVVDDYYKSMKPVKDFLRKARLVVSDDVKSDFADYGDWRRQQMGRLNIVKDNGYSVAQMYTDLQEMLPGQFTDHVMNEADQLRAIADFVDGIRKVEYSLDGFYGEDADDFRAWAKNDFDAAMDTYVAELNRVKRYGEDKTEQPAAEPVTAENAAQAYRDLKEQKRAYDMASAKNLLTDADEVAVGRILRGEDSLDGLNPRKYNVKGIREVVETKRAYEETAKRIREYKRSIKAARKETADSFLGTVQAWKDKKMGAQYSRETMERNIRDIVSDRKSADAIVAHYFTPVHSNEAAATRMKNEFRERVAGMNLSREVQNGNLVSEAHAVQLLGEATDNIHYIEQHKRVKERDGKTREDWLAVVEELKKSNPNMDWNKIKKATDEFRSIYDELFQQMNEVRLRNGYEPINYRKGYFPHFQPGDASGLLESFSRAMGISAEVTSLPTTINGLTHQFRPGIRWFGNAQQRLGFNTVYDAVEGFDKYIEGAADVIHHTDDIQNLRALSDQIRYRASDQGIREQVDKVQKNESLTDEEKQQLTNTTFEKGKTHLGNFVVELEEYTNLLANKRSRADRDMEQRLGRNMYNLAKRFESRVAANMVAINPGSWLTNFIPLTQGWTTTSTKYMLHGMGQTLKSFKNSDGIAERSDFLTNRRGSDPLVKMWQQSSKAPTVWQKVNAVSGRAGEILSGPMEYIDQFTAGSLVRARYAQNLSKGMSEEAALTEADAWTSGIMADRSKGSMPTVFAQQNPLKKVFTQFQLEVNNELSWLVKDVPDELKEKTLAAAAGCILKFLLGAFLYNELYEALVGRRSALDPLGILNDTVGDFTGYQLPNLIDWARGTDDTKTEKKDFYDTARDVGGQIAENLPFIGGVLGGGRVPISSALPSVDNLAKAVGKSGLSGKKRANIALKELGNTASYVVLPAGGSQIKKMYQGIKAVTKGGSYGMDNEGNEQLQYPIFGDTALEKAGAYLKAATFGKSSFKGARDWVESDFKSSMNADQTAAYTKLKNQGTKQKYAYELVQAISAETGKGANDRRSEIIRKSNLTDSQKQALYSTFVSDSRDKDFKAMRNAGMSWNQVMDTYAQYKKYDEAKGNSSVRASQFSAWVDSNLTAQQAKVVKDKLQIWAMMPANTDRYEKLRNQGLGTSDAIKLSETLAALEPEDERSQPTDIQKYQAIVDSSISDEAKAAGIKGVMREDVLPKYEAAEKYEVSPDDYVAAYAKVVELKEKYGKSSVSYELAKEAVDSIPGLSNEQRAALWQVQKKNFNPSKNPYSVSVGQAVYKIQYGLDESAVILP